MSISLKVFALFFSLILTILLIFLFKYNKIIETEHIDALVSKNIELIQHELTYHKKHALSLAILFSKNQQIISALEKEDRKMMEEEIQSLLNQISQNTQTKRFDIQVHTKELNVFYRSWEEKDFGLSLKSFRKGLVRVLETKKPFVSNELGKRLNIKAIAPIFNRNNTYIGSIEIIMDYTELQKRLELLGIKSIPFLKKQYLSIAKYHKNSPFIGDYVLISKLFDKHFYEILLKNPSFLHLKKPYILFDKSIITSVTLDDIDGKTIGCIVVAFSQHENTLHYLPQYEYRGSIAQSPMRFLKEFEEKGEIIIK